MRLINIHTLKLETFVGEEPPSYVCLSHRWSNDEPSYEEYIDSKRLDCAGVQKIRDLCAVVREFKMEPEDSSTPIIDDDDVDNDAVPDFVWIDTVCIDKRSSAELSEAINSMGRWYENCKFCIAYLSDVSNFSANPKEFTNSEWFRRGWTLQELLFPWQIIFFDANWKVIGRKRDRAFREQIATASGIPGDCLVGGRGLALYRTKDSWQNSCIAQKMSWAAKRKTTRIEDEAYCLLAIFDINMPLLYGEGSKAFHRLQTELLRSTDDESIFAWNPPSNHRSIGSTYWCELRLLAESPRWFEAGGSIRREKVSSRQPYQVTNQGLAIESSGVKISPYSLGPKWVSEPVWILQLNCSEPLTGHQPEDCGMRTLGYSPTRRACLMFLRELDGKFIRPLLSQQKQGLILDELYDTNKPCETFDKRLLYIDVTPGFVPYTENLVEFETSASRPSQDHLLTLDRMLECRAPRDTMTSG